MTEKRPVASVGSIIRYDRFKGYRLETPLWAEVLDPGMIRVLSTDSPHARAGDRLGTEEPLYLGHTVRDHGPGRGFERIVYPLGEEPDEYLVAVALQALLGRD